MIEKVVFAKGVIAEAQREEIKAEIGAKVMEVLVKQGDVVKAGDVLFTIDEGDRKLALQQEELSYQSKARDLEKAVVAADSETTLAPGAGHLIKWLVKEGDKVEDNTLVAEISDSNILEVTAPFGPAGIDKIKPGQKALVFSEEYAGYLNGTVTGVDRRGRADDGGLVHNVTVRFTNPGGVTTGANATIEVPLSGGINLQSLSNSGKIELGQRVKVKAGAVGTVLKLEVKEGDYVSKNSVLARLDITEGREALRDRQLAFEQAGVAREIKNRELSRCRMYAGQDGVVSEVNIVRGQVPPADKPAVVVSNVNGLVLKAKVEEADIPFLRVGQEAVVYANAFGDEHFPAVIAEVARQGKTEGNVVVFETEIRIKEPGALKVGMTGDADIVVERKEGVLRLPVSSVSIEDREGTVLVPGPAGPKPKKLKVGLEGEEFIEITGGLKLGEVVLINPNVSRPQGGF
ncbi:MAG: HlyD family efflux transporter periplasmic adaptor subunit [Firmicutes bacterium]|nr:HlyD family efflux transporter periplasmic adaptor subunit [Bacillota bacterium]